MFYYAFLFIDTINMPIPKPRSKQHSTITTPILKDEIKSDTNINSSPKDSILKKVIAETQTEITKVVVDTSCQTDIHLQEIEHITNSYKKVSEECEAVRSNLNQSISMASERAAEILKLQTENSIMKYKIENLQNILEKSNESQKDKVTTDNVLSEISNNELHLDQFKTILENMKKIEEEKDKTIEKYKNLLSSEKIAHLDTKKVAGKQIYDLKVEMDILERECNG